MTTKTELQEQRNALLDRVDDLENLINELPAEKEIDKPLRFIPKQSEAYYYINSFFKIILTKNDNTGIDEALIEAPNCFRRESTANSVIAPQKAMNSIAAFVEQFDDGWEADWSNSRQGKYYVTHLEPDTEYWAIHGVFNTRNPSTIYMSRDCAKALCEALNNKQYSL
jgi:hypothetical protein